VVNHIKTLHVKRNGFKTKKNEKPKEPKSYVENIKKILVRNARIANSIYVSSATKKTVAYACAIDILTILCPMMQIIRPDLIIYIGKYTKMKITY